MNKYDLLVIGAGPGGLTAALTAASRGVKVLVLERMAEAGLKLMATGGGHCNLTRKASLDELTTAFGRQGRFMLPALKLFGPEEIVAFFRECGVGVCCDDEVHYFLASGRAVDARDLLVDEAIRHGVEIRTRVEVERLCVGEYGITGVVAGGEEISASAVLLAAGGKGYEQLGSNGSGFALARQVGHDIVTPRPAMVPLCSPDERVCSLAGITLDVELWVEGTKKRAKRITSGPLLFTHRGISGPAVLDISGDVTECLEAGSVMLRANLFPGTDSKSWVRIIDEACCSNGKRRILGFMAHMLPRRLAEFMLLLAGVEANKPLAEVGRKLRMKIAELVTALPLPVTASEGWGRAMVTRGGVSLKGVRPETLVSRQVPGLFFAGEVLALDGPCGGYNLTWAFASGRLAGISVADFLGK